MSYPETLSAILVAGGKSRRFSSSEDKLLTLLNGQPVLSYSLTCLLTLPRLEHLVLVCRDITLYRPILEALQRDLPQQTVPRVTFVPAGETRRYSVWNGLQPLDGQTQTVLIHDAARPLLTNLEMETLLSAYEYPGISIGTPITDTIKQINAQRHVKTTMNRADLWAVQTPQVFDYHSLRQAHQQVSDEVVVTDDVQLMELAGFGPIRLIEGAKTNLKITTKDELILANAILRSRISNH